MFLGVKIQFLTVGVWALLGDFYWVFLLGSIQSLGYVSPTIIVDFTVF